MKKIVFWGLFFLSSLFIPYQMYGVALPWSKVFLVIAFAYLIVTDKEVNIYLPNVSKVFLLFVLLTTLLYFFKLIDIGYQYGLRDFFVLLSPLEIPFILLVFYLSYKRFSFESLFHLFFLSALLINVLAIAQFFDLFGLKSQISEIYGSGNQEQWDEYFQYNLRSFSVFNNQPNLLGLFNVFIITLLITNRTHLNMNNVLYLIALSISAIGLLTSGSITAIVLIFTALVVFGFSKGVTVILKGSVLLVVLALLVAIMIPSSIEEIIDRQKLEGGIVPSSLKARMSNVWAESIRRLNEEPLLGIGPAAETLEFGTDNEYLDKFLRYGYIGGTAFIMVIAIVVFLPFRAYLVESDSQLKNQYLASFLIALAFSLSFLSGSFFRADKITILFWLFYIIPFFDAEENIRVSK